EPKGNQTVEVTQEILTAGKRPLDRAAAGRGLDAAVLGLAGRKFEALTRLRRSYYDYQSLAYAQEVNRQVVTALEQGVEITRKLVEEVKTRPRTDLLRLQALLEQARANLARSQAALDGAWKQVAAEVGVPSLAAPPAAPLPATAPAWSAEAIQGRVLSAHTD